MEVLLVVGALVLIAAGSRGGARYQNWRGPECGTMDEVQRAHLELFTPPTEGAEDEEA